MRRPAFRVPSPVYPITDTLLSGEAEHPRLVERLLAGGARWIQLRDAGRTADVRLFEQARESAALCRHAGCLLIIDDRVDLALAAGADGVHLGDRDLPPAEARRILGPQAIIGYSTHSLKEAEEAGRWGLVDYLGLGPIFPTPTKSDPRARARRPLGLEALGEARRRAGLPVVAIGGITGHRLRPVLAAGADAAAMIAELMGSPDIAGRLRELLAECPAPAGS